MDQPEGHNSSNVVQQYKNLFADIDCLSIFKAPIVKGSIYFCIYTCKDGGLNKEELTDDPSGLEAAISCTGIDINYQDKHHRWIAKLPQSLLILEYATTYLNFKNVSSPGNNGVNAELKWFDEQDQEVIVHLSKNNSDINWRAARYIN